MLDNQSGRRSFWRLPLALSFALSGIPCFVQVLHIDRNNYYGGQSASLNLNQVYTTAKKIVDCTEVSYQGS